MLVFFRKIGKNGTVNNLIIRGEIKGASVVGAIAGKNSGVINNCINFATVSGHSEMGRDVSIGGIAGVNNSIIKACENRGTIGYSADDVGLGWRISGIANNKIKGKIVLCSNFSRVSGDSAVGGISGYNEGEIINCKNHQLIIGRECVSGIVGYNYNNLESIQDIISGHIYNCENFGEIRGYRLYGGIFGKNYCAFVEKCINAGDIVQNSGTIQSSGCDDLGIGGIGGLAKRKKRNDRIYGVVSKCINLSLE